MSISASFFATIRIALAVTLVVLLTVGSVSGAFAAPGDHGSEATHVSGGDAYEHSKGDAFVTVCPSGHGESHQEHSGDGMCCVGICASIVQTALSIDVPALRLIVIEPFYVAMLPRTSSVSFIRPPSLTI